MADRIVVTKTDLADESCVAALTAHAMFINQSAAFCHALHGATPDTLLRHDEEILPIMPRAYGSHKSDERAGTSYDGDKSRYSLTHATFGALERDAKTQRRLTDGAFAELLCDVRSQLEQSRMQMKPEIDSEHSQMIASTAFVLDEPVQWSAFSVWLTMLLHAHGSRILRFKALLNIADWSGPVVLDAVHHIVYPPRHLSQWPKGERLSRLVVIAQDLDTSSIAPSLRGFFGLNAQRTVMTLAG